ncbi:hypothetical protein BRADI_1g22563v3 [Brachypodium distachyon]|uniref:F-box domain-containing protein n=1 Tax=Brachypodium distachyon TaxID=15368 RepID=A0A2K2DKL3_BRADI|nr:hypothetical protein BRADI_1g22563v3 [Brachypodium distachyon]
MNMRTTTKLGRSLADPFSYCDGVNNNLIEEITSRLLALNIVNYTHFRATCKHWRDCTDDPRVCGVMDSRFRSRDWVEPSLSCSQMLPTFLNTNTLTCVVVDFPAELTTHRHLGTADGLIIIGHNAANIIYILNPLTRLVVKFPTITIEQAMKVEMGMLHVDQSDIIGTGIDDSTSTPTLVLRLRHESCQVICAKPGDRHSTTQNISSTLARSKDRMLMIRPKEDGYNETQMFLLHQPPSCLRPSCVEMFEVDVEGRRLVQWRNGVSFIREHNNVKVFTKKWHIDILHCR